METQNGVVPHYRPVLFVLFAFAISWFCAFWMHWQAMVGYTAGRLANQTANFLESASPLLVALFLLRGHMARGKNLIHYVFGRQQPAMHYIVTALLFAYQFLHFYLFAPAGAAPITLSLFLSIWARQIAFAGGLEEGGWRGYLQPALEQKQPVLLATLLVALIWAAWHIPYFIIDGTMHSGGSFLVYLLQTIMTAYTLTAIYKLTESVLLCTLFHGWQNTIVMTIPTDMGHTGFILLFVLQGALSAFICQRAARWQKQS